jgi:hypothetical protein
VQRLDVGELAELMMLAPGEEPVPSSLAPIGSVRAHPVWV